jgi:hypothetical protein
VKGTIIGDILKAKALEIWLLLSQYKDLLELKWLNGRLEGWKKRYNIKQHTNYSEASVVDANNPNN